ncbi:twin-arginine translocase subunit TatC [Phascolarctobacterium succinatutens]|uniref:twin-arginine translocase subunit TatC n=1 Tax=Phascolarctobacterium succinatutens TaxID=626940 RepID=UPI0026EECA55|nr:twin-arginine translocase subunit TatC [Phascolarctobacterium succinatutens]
MMPSKPNNQANDISYDKDMTLTEHLQELRGCLIKSIAALILGTGCSVYFLQDIMDILTAAAKELYYMRPAEAFMIYMKVALLSGLILSSPFILYELYSFVRPALTLRERHFMLICIPLSLVLFITGMLFSYSFVFPRGLEFFLGFAAGKVNPLISMESYLDFMLMLVVPFGFAFNVPVVLTMLAYLNIVSAKMLMKYQRHVILVAFIIAGVITPTPDIITQTLLAVPLILLYEVSIVIIKCVLRR